MSDAVNKPAHYNQGSIECIDAMQQILTPEEFRGFLKGNVFKYLWREKDKNGIEDLRKGKDYYDRLIELVDESEAEQLVAGEVAVEVTGEVKPPDGWRWLEVGEVIRKGDRYWFRDAWHDRGDEFTGCRYSVDHCLTIRRNKFEVGEKVVHVDDKELIVYVVEGTRGDGAVIFSYRNIKYAFSPDKLAPYIEEAK